MDQRTIVLEGGPHGGKSVEIDASLNILETPDFAVLRPAARPDGTPGVLIGRARYRDTGRTDAAGRRIFAAEE